jgi:hypothetical protein
MPESLSRRISSFVHTRCGGDEVEVPQAHLLGERKMQQFQTVALTTLCQIETAVWKKRLYTEHYPPAIAEGRKSQYEIKDIRKKRKISEKILDRARSYWY